MFERKQFVTRLIEGSVSNQDYIYESLDAVKKEEFPKDEDTRIGINLICLLPGSKSHCELNYLMKLPTKIPYMGRAMCKRIIRRGRSWFNALWWYKGFTLVHSNRKIPNTQLWLLMSYIAIS